VVGELLTVCESGRTPRCPSSSQTVKDIVDRPRDRQTSVLFLLGTAQEVQERRQSVFNRGLSAHHCVCDAMHALRFKRNGVLGVDELNISVGIDLRSTLLYA
jgi:hypothetical protein